MQTPAVTYDAFRSSWLESVGLTDPGLSSVQKGHLFAAHLLSQWLGLDLDALDPDVTFFCDGPGDGGLDFAYLSREEDGDTWYLVQSKYGAAYAGADTIASEASKMLSTVIGLNKPSSEVAQGVVERIRTFRKKAVPGDRVVYVLATTDALPAKERVQLETLITPAGQVALALTFDVDAVSLETLYARQQEATPAVMRVALRAQTVPAGEHLRVGATSLRDLYRFLKAYRDRRGDLSTLYEKNVRQYLGKGRVTNKAMRETLVSAPERFGLFNNGITIVASEVTEAGGTLTLADPYVVNGCQTTRTIFDVLHTRLEAGGSGSDSEWEVWNARLDAGTVIVKVVDVQAEGDALMDSITRFTNSQSAVQGKDFHALSDTFATWARDMAAEHNVFLEVQRGATAARKAWEKQHPTAPTFRAYGNAFDLLKVYAAAWMQEAGPAFGSNKDFEPEGRIFRRLSEDFNPTANDLAAALVLQQEADRVGFGKRTDVASRRQTRFLFYTLYGLLVRRLLTHLRGQPPSPRELSEALIALSGDEEALAKATEHVVRILERYFLQENTKSIWNEPELVRRNSDVNGFLKWDRLAKSADDTPQLYSVFDVQWEVMQEVQSVNRIGAALPASFRT